MLNFTLNIEYDKRTESNILSIPAHLHEIPLKTFSDFIVLRESWPQLYIDHEEYDAKDSKTHASNMTKDEYDAYLDACAEVIHLFVGDTKMRVVYIMQEHAPAQFLSIYYMLLSVMSQPPTLSFTFDYHDSTFILPESYTNRNEYTVPGYSLILIEAVEAFQYEHFYNAKDEQGAFILNDRRRQTIMAQCAAFCRLLDVDHVEQLPLNESARRRFMDERISHFADINLDIALSVEHAANEIKYTMQQHTQVGELFNSNPKNESEIKQAIRAHSKWQRWGWYTILQDVAEGNMFARQHLTPIESAMSANFWDAMFWLAHRADMSRMS